MFAAGLRNTHEFVFDAHGNLISVDNDGDHAGESERIVYIIDGSDSGWRSNWQYGKYVDPDNNTYKPWMDEGLFRPRFEGQAAYILPPVASYHAGPAGMAYNPGTALSDRWRNHFFVAEFTGSPARSRIFGFRLAPSGAGFTFDGEEVVTRGILATGIDFGPDGALYAADWVQGWNTNDEGRIWRIDDAAGARSALRAETRTLLAEDFQGRSGDDLLALLGHADMRVRMKAQFELADRGDAERLAVAAGDPGLELARLHGIWGLGQLARTDLAQAEPLFALLLDGDAEVRAQAAKTLGDVRFQGAAERLTDLLSDPSPRARFFAVEALGRLAHRPALEPILAVLEENDDRDAVLRHGAIVALARIGDAEALAALSEHPSRALRIAGVVSLRRLRSPLITAFLGDADEYVVTEAARAINDDTSIEAALPDLAAVLAHRPTGNEQLVRRLLNANLRVGGEAQARAVAAFAARRDISPAMRAEAVAILGVWPSPSILDRVDGYYRGPVNRDAAVPRGALEPIALTLLSDTAESIRIQAADAVARLRVDSALPTLVTMLRRDASVSVRTAALDALYRAGYADMEAAVQVALEDRDRRVRMSALRLIPELPLSESRAAELLASVLGRGTTVEQQAALTTLGSAGTEPAREVLTGVFDQLEGGSLDPALQLDAVEAMEAAGGPALSARLEAYRAAHPVVAVPQTREEVLAAYGGALFGGDAGRGNDIVFQNSAAQCVRCHPFGDYGGNVGPDLSRIGAELSREEILESLVAPAARIAPGYGEGGPSAMPPMGQVLTRRELRDVVAFLVGLGVD